MGSQLVILLVLLFGSSSANYGGNDLFTSLEAMKWLWQEEKMFATKLEKVIENFQSVLPLMEKYLENHKKLQLDVQEPNVEYLGHPVNAYNLIRHSAIGWKQFHSHILPKLNDSMPVLDYVLHRAERAHIPDHSEISGAALALARLAGQYDLNTEKLAFEGIIQTHLNMKDVQSKSSVCQLAGFDLNEIAKQSIAKKDYVTAIKVFESAIALNAKNQSQVLYAFDETNSTLDVAVLESQLQESMQYHDAYLKRISSRGSGFRLYPKLLLPHSKKEAKMIAKREKMNQADVVRGDQLENPYNHYSMSNSKDHYAIEQQTFKIAQQTEDLCAGKSFRVSKRVIGCVIKMVIVTWSFSERDRIEGFEMFLR